MPFFKYVNQFINTTYLKQNNQDFKVIKDSVKNTQIGYSVHNMVTASGHTKKTIQEKLLTNISYDGNYLYIGDQNYDVQNCRISVYHGWLMLSREDSKNNIYIEVSAISHNRALLALLANHLINEEK